MARPREIRPQPGFQTKTLSSPADIVVCGGAAGCGKTFTEVIAPARHVHVPGFSAVMFRRTTKQIKNPGGLWDEAEKIYPLLGARSNNTELEWKWKSTAKVKFAHLEHEDNVYDWQGAQIALIIFDELTHFTPKQFWYMLSRNRSTCGVRPQVMASCNPDADSWVAALIAWWIEQDKESPDYGLPIPTRAGVLRYFTRIGDTIIWGDSPDEVVRQAPGMSIEWVKSITFVPGRLEENAILEKQDPSYRGTLMSMSRVERARLLGGNWKAKAAPGDVFRRHEAHMLDRVPDDVTAWVRKWDLAATEPGESNADPDWTCGVLMGSRPNGRYVVAHAEFARERSANVRQLVKSTAERDPSGTHVWISQDPGQAGKEQAEGYVQYLAGFGVSTERETGDKETRAEPFASQWQAGNVDVVRGNWNEEYFGQLEGFPGSGTHDDAVDASAGAFAKVANSLSLWDVL